MKKMLISMALGLVLATVPMAIYAACKPEIKVGKLTCWLTGESCGGGVCVCSYNCG